MSGPDVRWEGVSHEQIRDWTGDGRGAAVTEQLGARLARVAAALGENSDQVNAALQRVDEWRGDAARAATEAMRVLRDFDDILGHHGTVNTLAAYGQSDNAAWARANVPPLVDVRATRVPTGTPLDALHATADHHRVLQAARDAEERARQVMREYESMTTTRIAALPPLSPAPSLVVATGDDYTIPVGPGPAPDGVRTGVGGMAGPPRPDAPPPRPAARAGVPTAPSAADTRSPARTPATRAVAPAPAAAAAATPGATPGAAPGDETGASRAASTISGNGSGGRGVAVPEAAVGSPRERDDSRPGGGLLGAAPGGEATRPGSRGGIPGSTVRGGPFGAVPSGTRKSDEDTEHRVRYAVPGSEIFEPDHDDGLLHDPFRPGSYVAPPAIGDDDE